MNNYLQMIEGPDSIRLGWALMHFLWQGLLIIAALEITLLGVGPKNASTRYILCGLALAVMPLCLMGTYWALGQASAVAPVQTSSIVASAGAVSISGKLTDDSFWPVVQTMGQLASYEISSSGFNRWIPYIVAGWFLGIVILAGRKAGGFIVLWRLQRLGISAPDDVVVKLFRQACSKIGVDPCCVCLRISTLAQVPMTMGWLRPVVLFPASLLTGLSAGEIELLIAHELAHIRRYDYLINLLQTVVETLFFYHPVTWWISRRMRLERENCCDDLVADRSSDALTYAKALLQLESIRASEVSLATAANGGRLLNRIQRLIGEPASSSGGGLPAFGALLLALALLGFFSASKAQTNTSGALPATITQKQAQETYASIFKDGKLIFPGADRVAVWINGHPILALAVTQQTSEIEKTLKGEFSGNELSEKITLVRKNALEVLIARELILEEFKAGGKTIPESYVDERINDIIKAEYGGDRNAFLKTMAERGTTLENYKREIIDTAIVAYMRNKYVASKVMQYYHDNLGLFPQDELIRLTFVTLPKDENVPLGDKKNPQYLAAQQALDQAKKGVDFEILVRKYGNFIFPSNGTTWIAKDGEGSLSAYPTIWPAVEKLQPGEISEIIESDSFYAIAKVIDHRSAQVENTEAMKKKKADMIDAKTKEVRDAWLGSLREKAKIQIVAQP